LTTTLYIDEDPILEGSFALGVLIIRSQSWVQQFRSDLHETYGPPPLYFHATDDKQRDKTRCHALRDHIQETLLPLVRAKEVAEWRLFKGKGEKQAWNALMQWITAELKPTDENPVNILHDRSSFASETKVMLSGYPKRYVFQSVDKIKSTETAPDKHKYLVGVVDYMLHFKIYKGLEKPEGKR
jgi:hypothetical protein